MIGEVLKSELDKLVEISKMNNSLKINLSTVLISVKHDENEIPEIIDYLENNDIEIINEDVEPDYEDFSPIDNSVNPFDPTKIDIKMGTTTIDSIIKRIKNDELEFDSSFQRKAGLWNQSQKSRLLESIFLKIPLPAFYFDASNDDKWQIIDGLQRITTLKEYVVEKKFALSGMEFLKDLDGLKYDELPRALQRRLEETQLNIYQVNPSTPKNVKFNIFKRINTGGLTLEPQEIRNALYQGKATSFLLKLSLEQEFKIATGYSIKSDRMLDREFCLRYIAFTEQKLADYLGNLDEYLNSAMEFLNKSSDDKLDDIEKQFKRTMSNCYEIFGNYAFRRVNTQTKRRGPVNKALFEAWSLIISTLNNSDIEKIKEQRSILINHFFDLLNNYDFQNAIKASDKNSVNTRISKIQNIVDNVLGDRIND